MAAGDSYPIVILNANGQVTEGTTIEFTDASNQPAQGGALEPPLVVPETGTTVLVTDTPDGDDLFDYDADSQQFNFASGAAVSMGQTTTGVLNAAALGSLPPYVTVQAGPPDPIGTYITPAVYDSTAVSGGLYLWDSAQYQQVGNVVA